MSSVAETNSAEAETLAGPELPDRLLAKLRITIPGYELLDAIAVGGQATIYRARELTSDLTVAIKVLHGGPNAGPDSRERLSRETATLKALNHPNIVCVIESGRTPIGLDYLVINYIDGRSLDALWKDARFSASVAPEPPARLRLFKRICDIVQAAHLKGITHRDLSPSNILITAEGEPHVLDFGLASTAFNGLLTPEGRRVSITGQFLGKVQYAAPEQARGGRDAVDIRTDVYALGVILYQILTNGVFPYEVVGNLIDVLNNIVHSKPLPPSAVLAARQRVTAGKRRDCAGPPLVNQTIEAVVLKALEKEPARRYQSAGELAADIDQYLAGRPTAAVMRCGAGRPAVFRCSKRRLTISIVSLILITGVLMSSRVILGWLGLATFATSLGAAPAAKPDAPELTSRQQNLLLQLSDAEANIQTINKALKLTGYQVGLAYDRIDSNLKGNEHMDRKGGGPVRWDEFYGKTAKDYGSNGWGDRRPQQFAFVYKANNDQIARAREQVGSLAKDQAALLERRQKHEADQSRLWATLAWEQVKDREIGLHALCRFALKPKGPEAAVLRPVILFLRTADRLASDGLDSVQDDQAVTFDSGSTRMEAAFTALQLSLADALDDPDLKTERRKEGEALKALCKDLSEQCMVIADNYANALDRETAKQDTSKLEFRGQLQASLGKFAISLGQLDDEVSSTAKAWDVVSERGTPTPDVVATVVIKAEHPREAPTAPNGEWVDLFNGRNLDGWEGLRGLWSVRDGVINGFQTKQGSKQTFLVYKGATPNDFELRFRYRFTTPEGNSGVQFRSKWIDPSIDRVGGYQADCDADRAYDGSIYDEGGVVGGRKTMSNRGESTHWDSSNVRHVDRLAKNGDELKEMINRADWNEGVVVAKGNHITFAINGTVTTDLTDDSPQATNEGLIALQLHAGMTMGVQFKDLKLRAIP